MQLSSTLVARAPNIQFHLNSELTGIVFNATVFQFLLCTIPDCSQSTHEFHCTRQWRIRMVVSACGFMKLRAGKESRKHSRSTGSSNGYLAMFTISHLYWPTALHEHNRTQVGIMYSCLRKFSNRNTQMFVSFWPHVSSHRRFLVPATSDYTKTVDEQIDANRRWAAGNGALSNIGIMYNLIDVTSMDFKVRNPTRTDAQIVQPSSNWYLQFFLFFWENGNRWKWDIFLPIALCLIETVFSQRCHGNTFLKNEKKENRLIEGQIQRIVLISGMQGCEVLRHGNDRSTTATNRKHNAASERCKQRTNCKFLHQWGTPTFIFTMLPPLLTFSVVEYGICVNDQITKSETGHLIALASRLSTVVVVASHVCHKDWRINI